MDERTASNLLFRKVLFSNQVFKTMNRCVLAVSCKKVRDHYDKAQVDNWNETFLTLHT